MTDVRKVSPLIAIAFLLTMPLQAHDFWIALSEFRPAASGTTIDVHLRVGENFEGEEIGRNQALVERFSVITASGEQPLAGRNGMIPAGRFQATSGTATVVYRGRPRAISLEAAKFETYLQEEGLTRIIAERKRRGEQKKPGSETYSRCAKALLHVESQSIDRPALAGLTLEILPAQNPYALRAGDTLGVTLLYRGKPLRGGLITAIPEGHASEKLAERSDKYGRASFRLPRAGRWLIKTVHMARATAAPSEADWESIWSSLTFELPAR